MRIMIGIGHPKQVHLWKNIVRNLIEDGHEIKILAADKDVSLHLLDVYGLDYETYGRRTNSLIKKVYGLVGHTSNAFSIAKSFKPDVLIAGTPYLAYVSKILRKPHIMITDTEHANLVYWLTYPFTDVIITPSCFKGRINPKKHVTFNGYFELAYLSPDYFTPDPSVLEDLALSEDDKFIIIRLVSWGASHDIHSKGISHEFLENAIKSLEEYGRVFITSEEKLSDQLDRFKIQIPPEKLHSALYYANLCFGDGSTTVVEAALVGTPAVHVEALELKSGKIVCITEKLGYLDELVNKYNMFHTFSDQKQALNKCLEILQNTNYSKELLRKKEKLIKDKVDVTKVMTEFIENYSESWKVKRGEPPHESLHSPT